MWHFNYFIFQECQYNYREQSLFIKKQYVLIALIFVCMSQQFNAFLRQKYIQMQWNGECNSFFFPWFNVFFTLFPSLFIMPISIMLLSLIHIAIKILSLSLIMLLLKDRRSFKIIDDFTLKSSCLLFILNLNKNLCKFVIT